MKIYKYTYVRIGIALLGNYIERTLTTTLRFMYSHSSRRSLRRSRTSAVPRYRRRTMRGGAPPPFPYTTTTDDTLHDTPMTVDELRVPPPPPGPPPGLALPPPPGLGTNRKRSLDSVSGSVGMGVGASEYDGMDSEPMELGTLPAADETDRDAAKRTRYQSELENGSDSNTLRAQSMGAVLPRSADSISDSNSNNAAAITFNQVMFMLACEHKQLERVQYWLTAAEQEGNAFDIQQLHMKDTYGATPLLYMIAHITMLDAETHAEEKGEWVKCVERLIQLVRRGPPSTSVSTAAGATEPPSATTETLTTPRSNSSRRQVPPSPANPLFGGNGSVGGGPPKSADEILALNEAIRIPPEDQEHQLQSNGFIHGANAVFHLLYHVWDNACLGLFRLLLQSVGTIDLCVVDEISHCTPFMLMCIYKCPRNKDKKQDNAEIAMGMMIQYATKQMEANTLPERAEWTWSQYLNMSHLRASGSSLFSMYSVYWDGLDEKVTSCFYHMRNMEHVATLHFTDTMYAFLSSLPSANLLNAVMSHDDIPLHYISPHSRNTCIHAIRNIYEFILQHDVLAPNYLSRAFEIIQFQLIKADADRNTGIQSKYIKMLNAVCRVWYQTVIHPPNPDENPVPENASPLERTFLESPFLNYVEHTCNDTPVFHLFFLFNSAVEQLQKQLQQQLRNRTKSRAARIQTCSHIYKDVVNAIQLCLQLPGIIYSVVDLKGNSLLTTACYAFRGTYFKFHSILARVVKQTPPNLKGQVNVMGETPLMMCVQYQLYSVAAELLMSRGAELNLTHREFPLNMTAASFLAQRYPSLDDAAFEMSRESSMDVQTSHEIIQHNKEVMQTSGKGLASPTENTLLVIDFNARANPYAPQHEVAPFLKEYVLRILITMLKQDMSLLTIRQSNGKTLFTEMLYSKWFHAVMWVLLNRECLEVLKHVPYVPPPNKDDGYTDENRPTHISLVNVDGLVEIFEVLSEPEMFQLLGYWKQMRLEQTLLTQTQTRGKNVVLYMLAMLLTEEFLDEDPEFVNDFTSKTFKLMYYYLDNQLMHPAYTDTNDNRNNIFMYLLKLANPEKLEQFMNWLDNSPAIPNQERLSTLQAVLNNRDDHDTSIFLRGCAYPSALNGDYYNHNPFVIFPMQYTLHEMLRTVRVYEDEDDDDDDADDDAKRERIKRIIVQNQRHFVTWFEQIDAALTSEEEYIATFAQVDKFGRTPLGVVIQSHNWTLFDIMMRKKYIGRYPFHQLDLTGNCPFTHMLALYYTYLNDEGPDHAMTQYCFRAAQLMAHSICRMAVSDRVNRDTPSSFPQGFAIMAVDESTQQARVQPIPETTRQSFASLQTAMVESATAASGRYLRIENSGFNVTTDSEVNIADFLKQAPYEHICIYANGSAYPMEIKTVIALLTNETVKYKCNVPDSYLNVDVSTGYFALRSMSILSDYVNVTQLFTMIAFAVNRRLHEFVHCQFMIVPGSEGARDVLPSTTSLLMMYGSAMMALHPYFSVTSMSRSHCQQGQGGTLSYLVKVDRNVDQIPNQGSTMNAAEAEDAEEPPSQETITVTVGTRHYPILKESVRTLDDLKQKTFDAMGVDPANVAAVRFLYAGRDLERNNVNVNTIPSGASIVAMVRMQ